MATRLIALLAEQFDVAARRRQMPRRAQQRGAEVEAPAA
jgi:hypothetical protein